MHGNIEDPLSLKLRSTLFELKRRGLNSFRNGCNQSPLIGVTLMTKRYKSKRHIQAYQNNHSNRGFNENEIKTQIFKRLVSKSNKKSAGLDISKAVIHFNQCKKTRVSTQRSFDSNEQNQMRTSSKGSLHRKFTRRKQVLATHRQNQSEFRLATNQELSATRNTWYSGSVHTQLLRNNRSKMKSMEMQMQRFESIQGWKVVNEQQNDYL